MGKKKSLFYSRKLTLHYLYHYGMIASENYLHGGTGEA